MTKTRALLWYHSQADFNWPDGPVKGTVSRDAYVC